MRYVDKVIDGAFEQYNAKYKDSEYAGAVLQGQKSKDKLNWYRPDETPASNTRWYKLMQVLKFKGWEQDHIEDLDHQSNDVVSNLSSPKAKDPNLAKGLVIGYVQSGKTANFSATIAKATDEGYKLVIVLSGLHNGLRYQTEKRLQAELTEPHNGSKSFNLTTSDHDGDFKTPSIAPNSVLSTKDKFTLAVLKKNASVLKKFTKWIEKASDEILADCPVLIIDDEADQASINNGRKPGDITAINKHIRKLLNLFSSKTTCSYVGYTATPFASILIDAKEESDLFPQDFIIALKAPKTYVGSEQLFGRASIYGDGGETGLDLIRHIEADDVIKEDNEDIPEELTTAMKTAIKSFFLAGAERCRRGEHERHITMLFHTSHLIDKHNDMSNKVNKYLSRARILIEEKDTEYLDELKDLWQKDFLKTRNNNFPSVEISSFDGLIESLVYFVSIMDKDVIKENSSSSIRLTFDEGPVRAIIVGGNTLSRGLTIEGLTVSYFHRTSTGYDTILQMGRWFGYRPGYLDLIRVFVTPEMESNFYHIATVEQELREDVIRMQSNNERPIDIALKIRDHDRLKITNKNVLRFNATLASNSYSGAKIQATHLFLDDEDKAETNFAVVKDLLTSMENLNLRTKIDFETYRRCLLYKNVSPQHVLKFLSDYEFSELDKRFHINYLGQYISKLNKLDELTNWSVAIMSISSPEEEKRIALEVNGLQVFAVERRQSPKISLDQVSKGTIIKNITVIRDELIDLGDIEEKDEVAKALNAKTASTVIPLRNRRPSNRGLILIYPIYTHHNKTKEQKAEIQLGCKVPPIISNIKHLFGITIVFPPTNQSSFEVDYVRNVTIQDSEDYKSVG